MLYTGGVMLFVRDEGYTLYSLDQMPLSISRHSRIVAAPPEVLNEIVATLE